VGGEASERRDERPNYALPFSQRKRISRAAAAAARSNHVAIMKPSDSLESAALSPCKSAATRDGASASGAYGQRRVPSRPRCCNNLGGVFSPSLSLSLLLIRVRTAYGRANQPRGYARISSVRVHCTDRHCASTDINAAAARSLSVGMQS
jgi:hypothetical protein